MTVIVVKRNETYAHSIRLVVWECPSCGVVYGIPEHLADACRADGSRYYCPNGHSLGWNETDADRERKRAEQMQRRLADAQDTADRYRENAERERRSHAATKGQLTKVRKRAAAALCPVPGCKRQIVQMERHLSTVHAEWTAEHRHDAVSPPPPPS